MSSSAVFSFNRYEIYELEEKPVSKLQIYFSIFTRPLPGMWRVGCATAAKWIDWKIYNAA